MINYFLIFAISFLASLCTCSTLHAKSEKVDPGEMCWWYDKPASKYWEGLPVGTGRLHVVVIRLLLQSGNFTR